jgi:hypothetical protein
MPKPIDKFIGLLGMHDHAFRQVEFLRLKRGLERGDAALLNGKLSLDGFAKDGMRSTVLLCRLSRHFRTFGVGIYATG